MLTLVKLASFLIIKYQTSKSKLEQDWVPISTINLQGLTAKMYK